MERSSSPKVLGIFKRGEILKGVESIFKALD
jgi:hypothetical protein